MLLGTGRTCRMELKAQVHVISDLQRYMVFLSPMANTPRLLAYLHSYARVFKPFSLYVSPKSLGGMWISLDDVLFSFCLLSHIVDDVTWWWRHSSWCFIALGCSSVLKEGQPLYDIVNNHSLVFCLQNRTDRVLLNNVMKRLGDSILWYLESIKNSHMQIRLSDFLLQAEHCLLLCICVCPDPYSFSS